MKNRFLLVGLGNILLRDEGIGVRVLEALRDRYEFSENLRLLDGGTLGLDLLPYLEGVEKVVFLDALEGGKEPGVLSVLEGDQIPSALTPAFSFHQLGLSDLLFALHFKEEHPPQVTLIGIQPGVVETGLSLSPKLAGGMDRFLHTVLKKLQEWGVAWDRKMEGHPDVPRHPL